MCPMKMQIKLDTKEGIVLVGYIFDILKYIQGTFKYLFIFCGGISVYILYLQWYLCIVNVLVCVCGSRRLIADVFLGHSPPYF